MSACCTSCEQGQPCESIDKAESGHFGKFHYVNIDKETKENTDFRRVIHTGPESQLVLMSVPPGADVGEETHPNTDQFIRIEQGTGQAVVNGQEKPLKDGSIVFVNAGTKHNVVNTGDKPLKLYAVYSPPHHPEDLVEATKPSVDKNFKPVRKIKFQGLDISIEHDKGHVRRWKDDATGEEGTTKMSYPYGYIRRTDGADGEQVDVFVGPNEDSEKVFVVHQMKKPNFKRYDEDKVMVGFDTLREAKAAYLMHFDDDRFLGSVTSTDITAFKRMYVKKSLAAQLTEARLQTDEMSKGLKDKLSRLWSKVKTKFKGAKDKPTKTWRRNSDEHCRTGVCVRLDGKTIPIDETFTAMKGMQVMGPPAHLSCKCSLDFDYSWKSFAPDGSPMAMDPMQAVMDPMAFIDPHDCETYEGCEHMLSTFGTIKDPELIEIASKVWGDGYTYEGQDPMQARMELIGFLMDQRDLLGVMPEEVPMMHGSPSPPSPSLPETSPTSGSTDYYSGSNEHPGGESPDASSSRFQESPVASSDDSPSRESSKNPQESSPDTDPFPEDQKISS